MDEQPKATDKGSAGGLEDIIRSLRALTRTGNDLIMQGNDVLAREIEMAVTISERIRDSVISEESLNKARTDRLNARFREDAQRVVNLVADVGGVAAQTAIGFVEEFTDKSRSPLAFSEENEPAPARE